jgi:hypothetical protein
MGILINACTFSTINIKEGWAWWILWGCTYMYPLIGLGFLQF